MELTRRKAIGISAGFLALLGAGAAQAAPIKLRIHTLVKSPHPYNDMAAAFKAQVEAESNGELVVEIFDSGQLGQDPAVIGEMGFGTIDLMISTTSNAVQQVPEYAVLNLPYMFNSLDEVIPRIGPGTAVEAHFQEVYVNRGIGMRLLALGASGTRNISTQNIAVTSPEDLRGLRMRTTQAPIDAETWASYGMLPVSVAWGEVYAALQTGVANALESSLSGYAGSKLYEVAPNLALTEHLLQINHISISDITWNRLSEDMRALVQKAAIAANQLGVDKAREYDTSLVESLANDYGVAVTRPDKAPFIAVAEPLQAKLAADMNLSAEYTLLTN